MLSTAIPTPSMASGALANTTNVPRTGSVLSSYKRTISAPLPLDKDSDELNDVDWPPTQQQPAPAPPRIQTAKASTSSMARSTAHWGARAQSQPPPTVPVPVPAPSAGVKRTYPWDVNDGDKRSKSSASTAFHQLAPGPGVEAGPSRPGAASLAKKSTANIRQKVVLSTEQQEVLRIVVDEGKSVFFTGSAGAWRLRTLQHQRP
jgi:ATP-dependent DNA helicase PIF1